MIIWLNGAFGAGKTQTAYELHRRLENSFVYDPENAGFFIRENLPPALCPDDFQDSPLWRSINAEMLASIAGRYSGHIIVPMTVTNQAYYDEITGALPEECALRHFILCAGRETLLKRLASRLEGASSWAARQIDRCVQAFDADFGGDRIPTDDMSIDRVVERVAELAGLTLTPDSRSPLRKRLDRAAVQWKHIR